MAHFTAALGRAQLWWAGGQLDELRRYCVNLGRVSAPTSAAIWTGSTSWISRFPQPSWPRWPPLYVPLDRAAMLTAARTMADYYRAVVPALAAAHDIPYPTELETVMRARLDALGP